LVPSSFQVFYLIWYVQFQRSQNPKGDSFSVSYEYTPTFIASGIPIDIQWSDITIEHFKEYRIERAKMVGDAEVWSLRATLTDSLVTHYIDTLDDDVEFQYRVRAIDQDDQYKIALSDRIAIPEMSSISIPDDQISIQSAFDSDFIDDMDSILIYHGEYSCSLNVLNKDVVIFAPNGNTNTFLKPIQNVTHPIVHINSGKLTGFTIIGGEALHGGGIFAEGNAVISQCVIKGNIAIQDPDQQLPTFPLGYGGGIHATDQVIIQDCVISDNNAEIGGGGIVLEDNVNLLNTTIKENYSAVTGGGIFVYNNYNSTINNCIIFKNLSMKQGTGLGGGMYNNGSVEIHNCLFLRNSAGIYGGGFYNDNNAVLDCVNSVFYKNTSHNRQKSYGVFGGGGDVEIMNSILVNNSGGFENRLFGQTLRYSLTDQMTIPIGEGNIIDDPMFVDPQSGNFHFK